MQKKPKKTFDTIEQLIDFLELDLSQAPYEIVRDSSFPFKATREFADNMEKRNWFDPLLLQVVPRFEETVSQCGSSDDPVDDCSAMKAPGVIHKYQGRVLLISSGVCAIHCRFCFRRAFEYGTVPKNEELWQEAVKYLKCNGDISEVILSGGDPLMLANQELKRMAAMIGSVEHVRTIRIHTRIPVVMPSRVNRGFLTLLSTMRRRFTVVVVIHVNHPAELGDSCVRAVKAMAGRGAVLFNQSVLLRGINDSAEVCTTLATGLFSAGVQPCYMHQLDRAGGACHFEVGEDTGRKILDDMRRKLPGYLVPQYVKEIPGEPYKTPIG